jgi:hypothetical protein
MESWKGSLKKTNQTLIETKENLSNLNKLIKIQIESSKTIKLTSGS